MKTVLMVAFQFPPYAGSSAVQRTLRFVRYLPEFGWRPIVLTAKAFAYDKTSDDLLSGIPRGTEVRRAFSLDTARHLGAFRRYPAAWARPDRWVTWRLGAAWQALRIMKRDHLDALWSTFPIPTAHLIAGDLHRRTGIPWIADFRDPMVQPNDPADPITWKSYERVERLTIANSQLNVFTTDGTRRLYADRYPNVGRERFAVVENGYDEEAFVGLASPSTATGLPLLLVHSGAIYPLERDPSNLFRALNLLRRRSLVSPGRVKIRLRATGHDAAIGRLIEQHDVADLVELAPPIAYRDALAEMMRAAGLLVLQADEVRTQVPAKLYEYLRADRPILGLTGPASDTAQLLRRAGIEHLARLDCAEEIAAVLADFLDAIEAGAARRPTSSFVKLASRKHRSGELAALLDAVAGHHRASDA